MFTNNQRQAADAALKEALALAAEDKEDVAWRRFTKNLLVTLTRRAVDNIEGGSATFVKATRPQAFRQLEHAVRVWDLDRAGSQELAGNVFIVGESANGGVMFPAETLGDLISFLEAHGLADAPCATYSMDQNSVRVYPNGLEDLDNQLELQVRNAPVAFTLDAVTSAISLFHKRNLVTPQLTMTGFWENQSGWLPSGTAENTIQWPLRSTLVALFEPEVIVQEEYTTSIGDVDFVFFDANSSKSAPPLALVETKVQKSFRQTGEVPPFETGKELIRGMIQVVGYSRALGVGWGALACFDLRKPGAGGDVAWANAEVRCARVLAALEKKTGNPLIVRNWLVFAQSEAAQAAIAMAPLVNDDPLYASRKRVDYQALLAATS